MEVQKKASLFIKESFVDMIFYGRITNKKSYPRLRKKIEYVLHFPVKRVFVMDVTKKERVYVQFEVKGQITRIQLTFKTPLRVNEYRDLKFTAQAHKNLFVKHDTGVHGYHWPKSLNALHVENDALFSISHLIYRSEIQDHTENLLIDSTIPYLVSWRPWRKGIQFEIGNNIEYCINVNVPINIVDTEIQDVEFKVFGFKDSSYQTVELVNTNLPARITSDDEENTFLNWKIPLLPVGKHNFTMNFKIHRKPNYLKTMPNASLKNIPNVPEEWIQPTAIWDRNKKTKELVNLALQTSDNIFRIISFFNHELNKLLSFKKSFNRAPVTRILHQNEANPMQYNDVFVSLLRQVTIPARLAVGFLYNPFTKTLEPHSWPEILLPDGSWFAFDPSFGYLNGLPSQHILQNHETVMHYPKQYWLSHDAESESSRVQVSLYYKLQL